MSGCGRVWVYGCGWVLVGVARCVTGCVTECVRGVRVCVCVYGVGAVLVGTPKKKKTRLRKESNSVPYHPQSCALPSRPQWLITPQSRVVDSMELEKFSGGEKFSSGSKRHVPRLEKKFIFVGPKTNGRRMRNK